jgi:predicted GNAT family N-acyltransferase
MAVREAVFVDEQHIPLENEFDSDDPRAGHWTFYESIYEEDPPPPIEVRDPSTKEPVTSQPKEPKEIRVPIGTIRVVPFPHPPHPHRGGSYVAGKLINAGSLVCEIDPDAPDPTETVPPLSEDGEKRLSGAFPSPWPPCVDRATNLHDGQEPYLKLGRLAVVKDHRGFGVAGRLIWEAAESMQQRPDTFDTAWLPEGMGDNSSSNGSSSTVLPSSPLPRWNGLFCCHAQETAVKVWERHGFEVDEAMGRWLEEGIPHYAMFLRIAVGRKRKAPGTDDVTR